MTVRPLQSAWRFSRNELSGKPGAVQSVGSHERWSPRSPITIRMHLYAPNGQALSGFAADPTACPVLRTIDEDKDTARF
jgi:hypothetical protein